jgi:hypothetical protein
MKKGLLSLLAVTLTIVSCQNYDDQFAELTGLVNNLTTQVAGVTEVQNDLSALSTLVGTLSTSLGTVSGQTAEIENIISGLASATTKIDQLQDILDSGVASQAELLVVSEAVSATLAGVNTLLTKNASLQADLIIVDSETLLTAQELILIGAQTPAKYILNGAATIDHTSLTAAEIVTANTLTAKLISITGATTVSGTVDLSGLTSLLGDYEIQSGSRPSDSTITTIGGTFDLDGKMGDVTYPNLRHVEDDVTINNEGEVTALDFGSIATFGGDFNGGSFISTKTTSVETGAFLMEVIDAENATLVELLQETIPAAGLDIDADNAATINVNAVVNGTGGAISVAASKTTNVFFSEMTTSAAVANTAQVAQFHIPKLKASAGTLDISADIVAAGALVTIDGTADFTGTKSVDLSAVTAVTALLTVNTNPVNLPLAVFTGAAELLSSTATTVIVKALSETDISQLALAHTNLTILSQDDDLTLTAANNPALVTLSVTASGTGGNDAAFDGTLAPVLADATVSGFITIDFGAATSALVTLTTAGTVRDLTIDDVDTLTSLNIGHTYDSTYVAAQDVTITGNLLLTSVDLSTVVRLEKAIIQDNAVLATITAPATTDILVPGAALDYRIGVTALAAGGGAQLLNSLTATYTAGAIAVSDGINNTPYVDGTIQQPSLKTWADYLIAVSANNTITGFFNFDADVVGAVAAPNTAAAATTLGTALDADVAANNTTALGMATQPADANQAASIAAWTGTINTYHELLSIIE